MYVLVSEGFFYVPLVLHTIGEDERAFLHCTSSVRLQILSFYRVRLLPPPHRETSVLSAFARPIGGFCSEERGGWFSDTLSSKGRQNEDGRTDFHLICHENGFDINELFSDCVLYFVLCQQHRLRGVSQVIHTYIK